MNVCSAQTSTILQYPIFVFSVAYLFTSVLCGDFMQWCELLAKHELRLAIDYCKRNCCKTCNSKHMIFSDTCKC